MIFVYVDSSVSRVFATSIIDTYNNYLTRVGGGGGAVAPQDSPCYAPVKAVKPICLSSAVPMHHNKEERADEGGQTSVMCLCTCVRY